MLRVIYQFASGGGTRVASRLDFPALVGIATLRAVHPEAEVLVLDYDDGRNDWGDFPDRLRFRVVPAHFEPAFHDGLLPMMLHRPSHVWEHAAGTTAYCDSDVLWTAPLPEFDPRYVHINPSNAGMYVFDPRSYRAAGFFGLWAMTCLNALHDQGLRDAMRAVEYEPYLHDESVYRLLRHYQPRALGEWLRRLPADEFAHPQDMPRPRAGRVHLVMVACGPARGALGWMFRETRPALEAAFTPDELREMFGPYHAMGGAFSLGSYHEALAWLRGRAAPP